MKERSCGGGKKDNDYELETVFQKDDALVQSRSVQNV